MYRVTRKFMTRFFLSILVCIPPFAFAEQNSFFLTGKYLLVGKAVDSDETYTGKVEIFLENETLKVRRKIEKQVTVGDATIESALNGDAKVLRIRFSESDVKYEETCLWRSDLNNYARISCYLYQPGVKTMSPGLEVLFYDHAAK